MEESRSEEQILDVPRGEAESPASQLAVEGRERLEKVVELCKRRGFVFPSGELYGGIQGFWDYGHYGVELRRAIRDFWWKRVVEEREDVVGLDSAIITHPETWVASGHVGAFHDLMVDDLDTKERFRLDNLRWQKEEHFWEAVKLLEAVGEEGFWQAVEERLGYIPASPTTGNHRFTPPRRFNLMFKTFVGPVEDESSLAWLRPETCQSIFLHFDDVVTVNRMRVPFGIAQVGKAFRNEITPQRFIFRSREFVQMELEFFVHPQDKERWFDYWLEERERWYRELGIRGENLRLRPHRQDELAHYAERCTDVEYRFPWGWGELEGIADRGDFDLRQHQEHSGKSLEYFDQERGEKYLPHVVECSAGLDRTMLVVLLDAYDVDLAETGAEARQAGRAEVEPRVVMRFSPRVAPIQVAVLPLRKNRHGEQARRLSAELRRYFRVEYDDAGSIGRRYRRQDEIGTPFCLTWDNQSDEDQTVTVRDRDSREQVRVAVDKLRDYLEEKFQL